MTAGPSTHSPARGAATDRVRRMGDARLPTRLGTYRAIAYRDLADGTEPVALIHGRIPGLAEKPAGSKPAAPAGERTGTGPAPGAPAPLVRIHSECWTGDVLGSLRCDCGEQLARALAAIATEPMGIVLYLRQEGRGIGLGMKLAAYELQDGGLDTVDANAALGLPIDAREYGAAAAMLRDLGLDRVRLMTNNPEKVTALEDHGIEVAERVPVPALANPVNLPYLLTKASRMGHQLVARVPEPVVTVHWAQTLDGRLATRTGDSQWIGGEPSLMMAHGLRAANQAVIVGAGTVVKDDPRLTVRLVEGPNPTRVVVDSRLRIPLGAALLADGAAPTIIATTPAAAPARRRALGRRGVEVLVLPATEDGRVDLGALLRALGERGVGSALVEGGAGLITSMLRERRVRRLVVAIAPRVMGSGIEAVGDLDILRLRDALTFRRASFSQVGGDAVFDGDLDGWAHPDG